MCLIKNDMNLESDMMLADVWHECYEQRLHDVIVPEAFAHPAKASWGLAQRIMGHLRDEWPRVTTVLDPMAGVGVFGLAAAYGGYQAWLGELEARFLGFCVQNIALHRARLAALGKPVPVLWRHDAAAVPLHAVPAVVTSPPYGPTIRSSRSGIEFSKCVRAHDRRTSRNRSTELSQYDNLTYGVHPAQIGNHSSVLACAKVYQALARVMPSGAPLILVLKAYVKQWQYIDLPQQTADLVARCGFQVVHWHEARLTAREGQFDLFGGETRRSRKSLFRRLAEKKGAPPIDAEVVLCCERM